MKAVSSSRSVALAIALVGWTSVACATQRYRIEAIGPVPNYEASEYVNTVGGLNNLGEVVFSYNRNIPSPEFGLGRILNESYISTANGIVSIPDLGGQDVYASDITDDGRVVGGASSSDTYQDNFGKSHYLEPFVSDGNQISAIATPTRGFSSATAANNFGDVIGYNMPLHGDNGKVFKWNAHRGYQNLGDFGAYYAYPQDINNRGDILINVTPDDTLQYGDSYQYRGRKAVIVNNELIMQVPDSPYRDTPAAAINDNGTVVGGFATVPGSQSHAYAWDDKKGFRDLGVDGEFSSATGINNSNVVIGFFATAYAEPTTAFVYNEEDGRHSLIDLIANVDGWWRLESADRINDRGQIAGIGYGPGGRRIYLATPIPEPSTLCVCLLSCIFAVMTSRHGFGNKRSDY